MPGIVETPGMAPGPYQICLRGVKTSLLKREALNLAMGRQENEVIDEPHAQS